MMKPRWKDRKCLVTGGASFIGSHLVEALVERGAHVRVVDDFSSGSRRNLESVRSDIELLDGDLRDIRVADQATAGRESVFHLAADHGGRGYISSHPANCAGNMALDQMVLRAAAGAGVENFVYASSACVYPTDIQNEKVLLKEEMVSFTERGGAFADEEYGWAKLMGELSLSAYHRQFGMKTGAARLSTVYGPRENESHALIALIAKAFVRQSPFEVWGDGRQSRGFTYVDDIVDGLILTCENIEDGSAVNLGSSEFISLTAAATQIFEAFAWTPPEGIRYARGQPVGVVHRALDGAYAKSRIGWEPCVGFSDGVRRTVDWYCSTHDPKAVAQDLEARLLSR